MPMRRALLVLTCIWGLLALAYGAWTLLADELHVLEALHEIRRVAPEEATVLEKEWYEGNRGHLALALTGLVLAIVSAWALRRRGGDHAS